MIDASKIQTFFCTTLNFVYKTCQKAIVKYTLKRE